MTFRVVLQVRIVYVSSQTDPTDSQSSPSRTVSGRVKARWGGEVVDSRSGHYWLAHSSQS
jgi:hypothetical protein